MRPATDGQGYELTFLDRRYLIDPDGEDIQELDGDAPRVLTQRFQILLLRYMYAPCSKGLKGQEVTEKELPGGPTFFQGPHAMPFSELLEKYGTKPDEFIQRGLLLGAETLSHGDRSLRFSPFPLMPVSLILWQADDEFPASMSVMFDSSISEWFELDMIFILVIELTRRILSDQ